MTSVLVVDDDPAIQRTLAIGLGLVALATTGAFVIRQRRARNPLYDLDVAGRRVFWVAACAGGRVGRQT